MTRIFYKPINGNNVVSTTLSPIVSLNEFLESVGNVDYVLIDDDTAFDKFQECLKIENGALSYDLALLKEAVQQVRKNIRQAQFKQYDDIILSIKGLAIPQDRLSATHAQLLTDAEAQRVLIWQNSETQKTAINNATTAEAVLAIWQEITHDNI